MERVIVAHTDYERRLQQELITEQKECEYSGCGRKATELFYQDPQDLHFVYCEKHADIIERSKCQKGRCTFDIETKEQTFEIMKELERKEKTMSNVKAARDLLEKEITETLDSMETDIQKIRDTEISILITGNTYKDDIKYLMKKHQERLDSLSQIIQVLEILIKIEEV